MKDLTFKEASNYLSIYLCSIHNSNSGWTVRAAGRQVTKDTLIDAVITVVELIKKDKEKEL